MQLLMTRLKLTVNETKTQVGRLPDERFDFQGYTIGRCYSPETGLSGHASIEKGGAADLPRDRSSDLAPMAARECRGTSQAAEPVTDRLVELLSSRPSEPSLQRHGPPRLP